MSRPQYELTIKTSLDPKQIIERMHEELRATDPISKWMWPIQPQNIPIYSFNVPLELPADIEPEEGEIILSVANVPFRSVEFTSEIFDILGMAGEPQTYVLVEFALEQFATGFCHVLRLMSLVLDLIEGDCFARMQYASGCIFVRRNGKVMIDASTYHWDEEEIEALGFPITTLTFTKFPAVP